jgi:hypothetical protein
MRGDMEHTCDVLTLEGFLHIREVADISTYELDSFWNGFSRSADIKQKHTDSRLL